MLHALLQYARDQELAVEPGFKSKSVRWLMIFGLDGRFLNVHPLPGDDGGGELIPGCPDLSLPEIKAGGAGCRHFLVDTLEVAVLWSKAVDDKLAAKHAYFVNLLEQAATAEPRLGPIAASLSSDLVLAKIHEELEASGSPRPKPTDNATVAILDNESKIYRIVDQDSWRDWWRGFRARLGKQRANKKAPKKTSKRKPSASPATEPSALLMRCLLSGESVQPVATHGTIKGLADVGGQSSGDRLASFKQGAFTSFGLSQAQNAAMSEDMAAVYVASLDDLLRNNAERLAGAKVAYWYNGQVPPKLDPFLRAKNAGLEPDEDDEDEGEDEGSPDVREVTAEGQAERSQAESLARSLVRAIRDAGRENLLSYRYHALTLSANSGRVVVRDWMEGRFEQLAKAVDEWFEDLRIISRNGKTFARDPKFLAVLGCLARDLKDIPSSIETALWRCAIGGTSTLIPSQVAVMAINRLRIDIVKDTPPSHARYGLLRSYCIRTKGIAMRPELDEHCSNSAYVAGRILAILGDIQRAANPTVDVGIVQRYYGAASTTPALVLGRLVQLANKAHLPQIKSPALRQWHDQRLTDAWASLANSPPRVLSLEEQSLFALGFYHQKARREKTDEAESAKQD